MKRPPARPLRTKGLSWVAARTEPKSGKRRPAGVLARVKWGGQLRQKWFNAGEHGGRPKAMRAAAKWVLATERELGKPSTNRLVLAPKNKQVGVRKRGATHWEAYWPRADGRGVHRTRFSIRKHGAVVAETLARQRRREAEIQLYGRPLRRPTGRAR